MTTLFAFNPPAYAATVAAMGVAGAASQPFAGLGSDVAQAIVGTLGGAELMAAQAGVMPMIVLADGTRGIVSVGGARSVIDDPSKWSTPPSADTAAAVKTMYLGAQATARRIFASAAPTKPPAGSIQGLTARGIGFLPAIPVAVYLVVVGVAAIAAAAYWATESTKTYIEIGAKQAADLARLDAAVKLASASLATTGKIDPSIWDYLKGAAQAEDSRIFGYPWQMVAGAGAAGAGLAAFGAFKLRERGWF